MNDLFTLLTLRDAIYQDYETAKEKNWSGLQAALSIVEQKIQAELDSREEYALEISSAHALQEDV